MWGGSDPFGGLALPEVTQGRAVVQNLGDGVRGAAQIRVATQVPQTQRTGGKQRVACVAGEPGECGKTGFGRSMGGIAVRG